MTGQQERIWGDRLSREMHQSQLDARRQAALERRANRRWWCRAVIGSALVGGAVIVFVWLLSGQAMPV